MAGKLDISDYLSNSFNEKLREIVDNYEIRCKIHELIDQEVEDLLVATCQECDLHRRYKG